MPSPDQLAGAVLHSLAQRLRQKNARGPVWTFAVALCTFGLVPLLTWPVRFRDFVLTEQLQLSHLAQWLRLHRPDAAADALAKEVERTGFRSWPLVIATVLVLGLMVYLAGYLLRWPNVRLWDATYGFMAHPRAVTRPMYAAWTLVLSAGYVCHLAQVWLHAADMRRFVARLNDLARREGLEAAPLPTGGFGAGAIPWLVAGVALAMLGVVWAFPLALAGALQRRYAQRTSAEARTALARRMQALLRVRRPQMNVPMPVSLRRYCVRELCRAPLAPAAKYCSRCGAAAPM